MNTILLTPPQFEQIEADAMRAYPNECCGIIFGTDGPEGRRVKKLQSVENDFESTEKFHRFSISPKQLMQAERDAAAGGMLVLGFYHSHPDHPARPSEYDRAHAWPFYSYIIIAVPKGEAGEMTCWVLDEVSEQFVKQAISAMV